MAAVVLEQGPPLRPGDAGKTTSHPLESGDSLGQFSKGRAMVKGHQASRQGIVDGGLVQERQPQVR